MSVAGKQRARSFTSEEKTLLLQLANAEKAYLKGRFGPTITKKGKQGKWKHIAQELNGMNGYGDRTGDDFAANIGCSVQTDSQARRIFLISRLLKPMNF